MTIASDFGELDRASRLVADIADHLTREKAKVSADIEALTSAGWQGMAADQYAQAWQDWVEGADRVLDALRAESRLLAIQRQDFQSTDGTISDGMSALHSRLGPS